MADVTREDAATVTIAQSAFNDGAAEGLYEQLFGCTFDVYTRQAGFLIADGMTLEGIVEHHGEAYLDFVKHDDDTNRQMYPIFSGIELRYC